MECHVAASTQNQALSALLLLYRHVLEQELPWLEDVVRPPGGGRSRPAGAGNGELPRARSPTEADRTPRARSRRSEDVHTNERTTV